MRPRHRPIQHVSLDIIIRYASDCFVIFADRKLVHIAKRQRIGLFEAVPVLEVQDRFGPGKLLLELLDSPRIEFEAEKRQPLLIQERRDFRDRKSVLHDIEQHVAAAAHTVEVDGGENSLPAPLFPGADQGLAERANPLRSRLIASLGDECPRFND